jgi:FKBP-type peptidyl-prolyl cis-trans isomerase
VYYCRARRAGGQDTCPQPAGHAPYAGRVARAAASSAGPPRPGYAAEELAKSQEFLAANKSKPGVQVLPSGLQYKVLKEGIGPMPALADTVTVQYRGTLPDGTEFASSYARGGPATIRVVGSIRGWQEALQRMRPGSKWMLYVPPKLGYGEHAFGKVPPNSVLIYELELLSVNPTPPVGGVSPRVLLGVRRVHGF